MTASIGVLLAGGRSRRFGEDKREALLGGITLTQRAGSVLSRVVDRVVLSVGSVDIRDLPEMTRVVDPRPDEGPLGGVLAGLSYCRQNAVPGALFLAVDLPAITDVHLRHLLDQVSAGAEIVAATGPGGSPKQPLCAWYSTELLASLEQYLQGGSRKVSDFVDACATTWVALEDPAVLVNINTPQDLLGIEGRTS